jgi:hypothetical protein
MGTSARPKIHFFDPKDEVKPVKIDQKAPAKPVKQPKAHYRLTNWPAYNQALIHRGSLQLWVEEDTLKNWYYQGPQKPGGAYRYSDACIECALRIKYVLSLAFRQTQGFIASLFEAMKLDLQIPSYTQLCRRQAQLTGPLTPAHSPAPSQQPTYVVIDSTGLKVYGEGEWKVRQHGTTQRRTWRKVHVAYDEANNQILAIALTTNDIDDASMLEPLLAEVVLPISRVGADGAYDRAKVYDYLQDRQIQAIIPPRCNAVMWTDQQGQLLAHARNEALVAIEAVGLAEWKKQVGYHRRSKAETGMYRLKTTFGERLQSRGVSSQKVEVRLKAACLNRFSSLGMPKAIKQAPT